MRKVAWRWVAVLRSVPNAQAGVALGLSATVAGRRLSGRRDRSRRQGVGDAQSIAIGGFGARIGRWRTIELRPTVAIGTAAIAVGLGSETFNDYATALGAFSTVDADNAIAIGANSLADRDNTLSVGSAGDERQVTNVAAGTEATDAVNLSQLESATQYVAINGAGDGSDLPVASGANASAVGALAVAVGDEGTALGYQAYAEGTYATAVGSGSFALGEGASAFGTGATALGRRQHRHRLRQRRDRPVLDCAGTVGAGDGRCVDRDRCAKHGGRQRQHRDRCRQFRRRFRHRRWHAEQCHRLWLQCLW